MIFEIRYDNQNIIKKIEGNKCIVGRSRNADIQIDKEALSRNHFEIEWDGKNFYLTDLNSTNGVYVNSERIPTSERIIYKNFFPIEIGGEITIYVKNQDEEAEKEETEESAKYKLTSPTLRISEEATRQQPGLKGHTKRIKDISKENKTSSKRPLLTLIVLLGGGYFFYQHYSGMEEQASVSPSLDSPQEVLAKNSAPAINLQSLDFKSFMQKNDCPELNGLCQTLKLNRPHELISIQDNKFIVYVNFNKFVTDLNSVFLSKEPSQDQAEYALAFFATHPALTAELTKRNMTTIIIVGIDPIDDLIRMKYASSLNLGDVTSFTQESHAAFFSEIFHGGVYRPFRISLRPHLNFTSF